MKKSEKRSKIPYAISILLTIIFLLLGVDCVLGGMTLLGIRYLMLALGMLCIALGQPSFLPIALIVHAIITFLSQGLIKANTFFTILSIIDLIGFILMILIPAFIYMVYMPKHDRYTVDQSPEDAKKVLDEQLANGQITDEQYQEKLKSIKNV